MDFRIPSIKIITLLLVLFFIISWFSPAYWNWGVFNIQVLTSLYLIVSAIVVLILFIPQLGLPIMNRLEWFSEQIQEHKKPLHTPVKTLLWILIPAVILFLLKSSTYILGDGHLILDLLSETGALTLPGSSFGICFLITALAKLLGISSESQAAFLMSTYSIVCGILFVYFAYKIVNLLITNKKYNLIVYVLVCTSALIIMFTGYVETYPLLTAWLAIYLYYAIRFIRGEVKLIPVLLIFLIGVFWHLWFLAFIPSLIYVLNKRYKFVQEILIIIISVIAVLGIYISGQLLTRGDYLLTVPFLSIEKSSYTLLSVSHLADYLNNRVSTHQKCSLRFR